MNRKYLQLVICILIYFVVTPKSNAQDTVGWLEKVYLNSGKLKLVAKLDTGAKTTSLGYSSIQYFKKENVDWVSVSVTNKKNFMIVLEKPVIRFVNIKQHVGEKIQQRPIIKLGICLKDTYKEVEVDLMDRSGFNYTMLIGRNFLTDKFVVDSARIFTQKPHCNQP